MKRIIAVILSMLFCSFVYAGDMVNPIGFKGTDKEKKAVISFIKDSVKKRYTSIGMDNATTLRMMENKELEAFKKLTKVKNHKLLNKVRRQYCDLGMCAYATILMMYNKENKASKQELEW